MQLGEGRESRGRWGGAYVERLGGPKEAGWGGDDGASPEKGRVGRTEASRGAAGQLVTSQRGSPATTGHHRLLLLLPQPQCPVRTLHMAWQSWCPAPCPLCEEGEGEGKPPAWGGWERGREMMAPTRHQETGPAAALSPMQL